jgi:hypothetical protein
MGSYRAEARNIIVGVDVTARGLLHLPELEVLGSKKQKQKKMALRDESVADIDRAGGIWKEELAQFAIHLLRRDTDPRARLITVSKGKR